MMKVRDMMTGDPACCTAETSLPEVARMMVDRDCGEIPVVDNTSSKVPIGVVTDRDIVCRTVANGLNPLDLTAADCMSIIALADIALHTGKNVAGHIVKEVSEPTSSASAASAATR